MLPTSASSHCECLAIPTEERSVMSDKKCKPNCWGESLRDQNGRRARVYERYPGSHLQIALWIPGSGIKRVTLGHKDRERAKSEARALLAHRPAQVSETTSPTM